MTDRNKTKNGETVSARRDNKKVTTEQAKRSIEELYIKHTRQHEANPKNVTQLILDHIADLVNHVQYPLSESALHCSIQMHFRVDQPDTAPTYLKAIMKRNQYGGFYKSMFTQHIFPSLLPPESSAWHPYHHHNHSSRTLPYNVSVGIAKSDFIGDIRQSDYTKFNRTNPNEKKDTCPRCCFGSSSPKGFFSVTNYEEMRRWSMDIDWVEQQAKEKHKQKRQKRNNNSNSNSNSNTNNPSTLKTPASVLPPITPFGQKPHKIPVFRGSGWSVERISRKECRQPNAFDTWLAKAPVHRKRLHLMQYSKQQRPDLVNAALVGTTALPPAALEHNATNGLHQILPMAPIPRQAYFNDYQTAIVMGGWGAAFRTPIHLMQQQAVILQDYPYEEWYVRFLEPFVHYIPLAMDISNLQETLEWVRDNPARVQEIAENGQQFYRDFLSWPAMEEFWYQLLYQLALREREYHDKLKRAKRK